MISPRLPRGRELLVVLALFLGGLGLRLALAQDYVFAGADSYGYLKLADEWRAHGRYALGPSPEPLYFARTPLYPAFLMFVKGEAKAEMSGGPGWGKIVRAQAWIDVLVTGVLVWWLARRLAGSVAGAIALGMAMFVPFTVITVGAALTECLAVALTTASVAPLMLGRKRPEHAFFLSGVLVALSTLLRPDGILAGIALGPALLYVPSWRRRARVALLFVLGFAITFAPWPIRNLRQFGAPWAFGTRVGRGQQPVFNWEGPHHFMQSYGRDWHAFNEGTKCMFDAGCSLGALQAEGAFENERERAEVQNVLRLHAEKGLTPFVSQAYEELARAHVRRHPLRSLLWYPIRRAAFMWGDSYDEIFQKPPLPRLYHATRSALPAMMVLVALGLLVGSMALLLRRESRLEALVLVGAIGGRTAVLAYTFYCMTRYVREVMPLGYVVTGCGLVVAARWVNARLRARRTGGPRLS